MFRYSILILCSAILVCTETCAGIANTVTTAQSAGDTISFLKKQEGFNPKAYGDFHQRSIGYGTKALPGEKSISPQDAETRLQQEAAKVDAWINRNVEQPLTQGQRTALTSFGYNLGTGKGGLSDLLVNINAGNWQSVANQMGDYIHSGGHTNPGLIKRRYAERGLLFRPDEDGQPPPVSSGSPILRFLSKRV